MLILPKKVGHYKIYTLKRLAILKLKKQILTPQDSYFLGDIDIKKVLVSKKISLGKRNYETLLVTCANQARGCFLVY